MYKNFKIHESQSATRWERTRKILVAQSAYPQLLPEEWARVRPTFDMYWNGKYRFTLALNGAKLSIISKNTLVELVGSKDSSLHWLILSILFFLKLYCKDKKDFGTFTCIF